MSAPNSPIRASLTLVTALALTTSGPSWAQETLDLGVLKAEDISVIQKKLYDLDGRTEMGYHAGWMPFDAFTTTPVGALSYTKHRGDGKALEVALGGGYGFKNGAFRELESEAYGVAPDAYRYLGSVLVDMQWAPVYAKIGWGSHRIFHHDLYGLAGAGITAEQAILPDHTLAVSPTLAVGVGARVFTGPDAALRIQIRDDLVREYRLKTSDTKGWFLKQNVAVTVGYARLGEKGG